MLTAYRQVPFLYSPRPDSCLPFAMDVARVLAHLVLQVVWPPRYYNTPAGWGTAIPSVFRQNEDDES